MAYGDDTDMDGSGYAPQSLIARRRLAEAMMREGINTGPIQHWSQGLARMVNAYMGGKELGDLDRQEKKLKDDASKLLQDLPGLGGNTRSSDPITSSGSGGGLARVGLPEGGSVTVASDRAEQAKRLTDSLSKYGVEIDPTQTGGYSDRNIRIAGRDTGVKSKHAHGDAVDVNYRDNPDGQKSDSLPSFDVLYGTPEMVEEANKPSKVITRDVAQAAAADSGAKWGGDFKSRSPDPMHFEFDGPGAPSSAGAAPARPSQASAGLIDPATATQLRALLGNERTRAVGLALYQKVLERAQPEYKFHAVGDSLYRINPKTGNAEQVAGVAGPKPPTDYERDPNDASRVRPIPGGPADPNRDGPVNPKNLSPAQKSSDTAFGKDYAAFVAGGGHANFEKNMSDLRAVTRELRDPNGSNLTGAGLSMLPESVRKFTHPASIDAKDRVANVIQQSAKAILGGQYTEKEGMALIQRAYNPALSEEANAKRLDATVRAMERAYASKKAAIEHYEKYGTISNYKGSPSLSMADIEREMDSDPLLSNGGSGEGKAPAGGGYKVLGVK